ncbi:MAG: hypothetical protein WC464_00110 [Bdellovibrionales bacterium]
MDKKLQSRFFTIMGCYLDDDRIAAWAVSTFRTVDSSAEMIYKDLLACRVSAWIDYLEHIAEDMKHIELKEWCMNKQFELDIMRSPFWSRGDDKMIEMEAWKV